MSSYQHWASSLEIGDRVIATIRHKTDGKKNIIGAIVIVAENNKWAQKIKGAIDDMVFDLPYNELTAFEPTEVSKVKCDICTNEWVAVRPAGMTKLECPHCSVVSFFENVE